MALPNVTFWDGIQRLFYIVPPSESSFEKLEDVPDYISQSLPFFFGAMLIEVIVSCLSGAAPKARVNDGINSMSAGMLSEMMKMVTFSAQLTTYVIIYNNMRITELPWNSPYTWWICFIGVDLGYYVFHRLGHVNIMWAAHQVHHSSEEYNLTTALRQGAMQGFTSWIFYLPLALAVPPPIFMVHTQFNILYQFWIHTEVVKSLGPLEYILNTPSHHRVHHGRNRYCIDKNYGGTLIIWDRLFGTFQAEEDHVVYGLTHPLMTWDPVWAQASHFKHIWCTFWQTKGVRNKVSVLFKGPGWSPGKPRLGEITDIPDVHHPHPKYNSELPLWATTYVFIHFFVTVIVFSHLGLKAKIINRSAVNVGVMCLIFSLVAFGALFDKKWYAPYLETVRVAVFLMIDIATFTTGQSAMESLLGFPSMGMSVLRLWFMFSVSLWVLLSAKQVSTAGLTRVSENDTATTQ
ncbi:alkylglycerol monooxygenase-like isoform X2 [Corticium candelabrum]|uniref:alkylglycerol monooxygenase-like isoform X2 n=1 Tax=Corticium candelabrum TaxID=121492 RepID=UPI002E272D7B|nr:alkylglycerol monooxygenase-like isoform X2 [Corticium candelabrum]